LDQYNRKENIRIYGIPEDRAGLSKCGARLEALLRVPLSGLCKKLRRASSNRPNHRNQKERSPKKVMPS